MSNAADRSGERGSFRRVWLWPIVLAALSTFGLVSALVGDGVWDVLSWLTLAPPLVVSIIAWKRSRPQRSRSA